MALFTIEHCDYSKLSSEELRRIKWQWDRMNSYTCAVNTAFLLPVGLAGAVGVGLNVVSIFQLTATPFNFIYLIPLIIFLVLTWSIARMKYEDLRGYIVSAVMFVLGSICFLIVGKGFIVLAIVLLIPVIFDIRSIRNYAILDDLKKVPGYPYFTYTSYQRYSPYIPNEGIPKDQIPNEEAENYKPWNPFDIYDYIGKGEKEDDDKDKDTDEGNDI